MTQNRRQAAEKRGHRAEWLAAMALRVKGYRIVARRYKTRVGEIDIIARRRDLVLLVEVKARANITACHDAVTSNTARRIEAAGDHWLARQPDAARLSIRRDLVAVVPRKWPVHFADAF